MIFWIPQKATRLEYILLHLFQNVLGHSVEITDDFAEFEASNDAIKIVIGKENISNAIILQLESDILFESTVSLESFTHFLNNYHQDFLTFSFLLLSRYQEYLPHNTDEHGRFPFSEDEIFKKIDVLTNWVDQWILEFAEKHSIPFKNNHSPEVISTIDIDRLWRFQTRKPWELIVMHLRAKWKKDNATLDALREYRRTQKDPYDNFDYVLKTTKDNGWKSIFFLLLGKSSDFDKNISVENEAQAWRMKSLATETSIGLHPSYYSSENIEVLRAEKRTLEKILDENILKSRQHYVRMNLPETYQNLIKAGFKEDYSMGFAEQCGFRAGTAYPFLWFDLSENRTTSLQLYPFVLMDVSLLFYMRLNVEESLHLIQDLKKKIKKTGGYFIHIFHNQNLTEQGVWKGWRKVFEECMKPF